MNSSLSASVWWRRGIFTLFGILFAFEGLNYIGVLSHKVDYTWFGRLFSTIAIFGILQLFDWLFHNKLSTRLPLAVWTLTGTLLLFDFIGDIFSFYTRWMWYDQVAHFLSGPLVVCSLLITLEAVKTQARWHVPRSMIYTLALGMSTIFAVLYEIEEYLEDYFFQAHRLGDGPDTVNDLMLNFLGGTALLLCVVGYRGVKRG